MAESQEKLPDNVAWQLTTTTIWCPEVEKRVTLIVKGDWTSYCCWYLDHKGKNTINKIDKCMQNNCSHVAEYKNRLVKEEMNS